MVCFVEYDLQMLSKVTNRFRDVETLYRPTLIELLEAMSPVLRTCMLEYFAPSCCIGTCKIAQEILAYYGFTARAFATTVYIYNAAMQRLVDTGVEIPDDCEERIALFNQTGAWGVGIVPNGMTADGSLQQAQRIERDIVLPPLLWFKPTPAGFFASRVKAQRTAGMLGDCMVVYRRLENPSYLTSPNWRQKHAGIPEVFAKVLTLTALGLERARKGPETASGRAADPADGQTPIRTLPAPQKPKLAVPST